MLCQFNSLHSCMYMSDVCCNSLSLFSNHLPDPLDPLVESLVTCQKLTSLEMSKLILSFQNLMTLVKGLHNLRALGLKGVYLSDEEVSD